MHNDAYLDAEACPDCEYEIDTILDEDDTEDGMYYLVKWKGFSHEHNSWVKGDDMNADELLAEWLQSQADDVING